MLTALFNHLNPGSNTSLSLVSFVATISLSALMIMPLFVGTYIDHLGFSEAAAGWISAANLAGIALTTLIISLKTKHWPLGKIALIGLLAMIALDTLCLYFQSLPTFTVLRFLSGMAAGAAPAATAAAIARLPSSEKGYGIYICFQFLLSAIAFYGLAETLPDLGFNGMMKMIIALEIIALCAIPIYKNYPLPNTNIEIDKLESSLLLQRPAFLSLAALCVYGAATASVWAYADRIGLEDSLSFEQIGSVLSLITAISVLGAFLVTFLGNRFGHIKPLSLGIMLQVIGLVVLMSLPTPIGYCVGIGIFSVAWAFAWPYFLSIQADIDNSGTVVVAGQLSNLVGNSIGPAMAALIVADSIYSNVIWMAIGLSLLSLSLVLLIPLTFRFIKQAPA